MHAGQQIAMHHTAENRHKSFWQYLLLWLICQDQRTREENLLVTSLWYRMLSKMKCMQCLQYCKAKIKQKMMQRQEIHYACICPSNVASPLTLWDAPATILTNSAATYPECNDTMVAKSKSIAAWYDPLQDVRLHHTVSFTILYYCKIFLSLKSLLSLINTLSLHFKTRIQDPDASSSVALWRKYSPDGDGESLLHSSLLQYQDVKVQQKVKDEWEEHCGAPDQPVKRRRDSIEGGFDLNLPFEAPIEIDGCQPGSKNIIFKAFSEIDRRLNETEHSIKTLPWP